MARQRIGTLIRTQIAQVVAAVQKPLMKRLARVSRENRELKKAMRRHQAVLEGLKARALSSPRQPRVGGRPIAMMSAEDIRTLRGRLGLSRAQLAELAGVSAGAIYLWESGRSTPRGSSIERLRAVAGRARPAAANGRRRGRRGRPRARVAAARRPMAARRGAARKRGGARRPAGRRRTRASGRRGR